MFFVGSIVMYFISFIAFNVLVYTRPTHAHESNDVSHLITKCTDKLSRNDTQRTVWSSCFCDSYCQSFNDCCIDNKVLGSGVVKNNYLQCTGNTLNGFLKNVKRNCVANWNDSFLQGLCEGSTYSTLGNITVTSTFSGLTYANMFCAICNDEKDEHIEFWLTEFKCDTSLTEKDVTDILYSLYKSMSAKLLTNEIELIECDLNFKFPSWQLSRYLKKCAVISTCSERWQSGELNDKCLAYASLVIGEQKSGSIEAYRNPHCALCNGITVENIHLLEENIHISENEGGNNNTSNTNNRNSFEDYNQILDEYYTQILDEDNNNYTTNLNKTNSLKQNIQIPEKKTNFTENLDTDSIKHERVFKDSNRPNSPKEETFLFTNIKFISKVKDHSENINNQTSDNNNNTVKNICKPTQAYNGEECIDINIVDTISDKSI